MTRMVCSLSRTVCGGFRPVYKVYLVESETVVFHGRSTFVQRRDDLFLDEAASAPVPGLRTRFRGCLQASPLWTNFLNPGTVTDSRLPTRVTGATVHAASLLLNNGWDTIAMACLSRCTALALLSAAFLTAQRSQELRVGVGGTEPFAVVQQGEPGGIAVEIWQLVAAQAGWRSQLITFPSVPDAMAALKEGKIDAVVGPISITAERAEYARFSQPFYSVPLAILSRSEPPTLLQRIQPFFSEAFFIAVGGLVTILALVGTLIWLAERRRPDTHFPPDVLRGIGSGIWFAVVTMSTVGYGDMAPRTLLGRTVTAVWIVVSVVAATSLVAGIAGTIVLTGSNRDVVSSAEQFPGRRVAALANSPGEVFTSRYGARVRRVASLANAYALLEQRQVDAVVFDRPQLQYFLKQRNPQGMAVAAADYDQQNYGFALAINSTLQRELNLNLLRLRETGAIDRIVEQWVEEE